MRKLLLPFSGILVFLSSCTHFYYAPSSPNVPVFKEKNEARLSGAFALSDKTGAEIQAGYAVTNNMAVIANANVMREGDFSTGGRGHLYELGAGYFKPLNINTKRAKNLLVFEVYGVAGLGGYRNFYWDTTGQLQPQFFVNGQWITNPREFYYPNNYITTRFFKAYIQPSISFSHDIIDIILCAKIGLLQTYSVTSTIPEPVLVTPPNPYQPPYTYTLYGDWETNNNNQTPFLFEPSMSFRLGWRYVKLQLQYSSTLRCNSFARNVAYNISCSFGLSVDIGHRFLKKSKRVLSPELH